MSSDPFVALGRILTGREAEALAEQLDGGLQDFQALRLINPMRREGVSRALATARASASNGSLTTALRAIAGAKEIGQELTPVWTMPGNGADTGRLTGEFHRLVQAARQSIVCATYNFEPTSKMWTVLRAAAAEPGLSVVVYVDGDKADGARVKSQLGGATVYRSAELHNGKRVVSHAKFVAVDHEILLLTSANFSFSAENKNVELGLLVHDPALTHSVESTMAKQHGTLYELVG